MKLHGLILYMVTDHGSDPELLGCAGCRVGCDVSVSADFSSNSPEFSVAQPFIPGHRKTGSAVSATCYLPSEADPTCLQDARSRSASCLYPENPRIQKFVYDLKAALRRGEAAPELYL